MHTQSLQDAHDHSVLISSSNARHSRRQKGSSKGTAWRYGKPEFVALSERENFVSSQPSAPRVCVCLQAYNPPLNKVQKYSACLLALTERLDEEDLLGLDLNICCLSLSSTKGLVDHDA